MSLSTPTDDIEALRERLGDLQSLAAEISKKSTCRSVSQVFSKMSDLIWEYFDPNLKAIHNTCEKCHEYLAQFDASQLQSLAPGCSEKIESVFEEVDELYEKTSK